MTRTVNIYISTCGNGHTQRPISPPKIRHKKSLTVFTIRLLRSRADSNRCSWFCRPKPSHSATRPFTVLRCAKIERYFVKYQLYPQIFIFFIFPSNSTSLFELPTFCSSASSFYAFDQIASSSCSLVEYLYHYL